jgi:hypothetical protein
MAIFFISPNSHVVHDNGKAHVGSDHEPTHVHEGSRWLRHSQYIDERVRESKTGKRPDEVGREEDGWVRAQVEETDKEEGKDVLDVVEVCATDSLNVVVAKGRLGPAPTGSIFGVCKNLWSYITCILFIERFCHLTPLHLFLRSFRTSFLP